MGKEFKNKSVAPNFWLLLTHFIPKFVFIYQRLFALSYDIFEFFDIVKHIKISYDKTK